jgi:hypothetical protein
MRPIPLSPSIRVRLGLLPGAAAVAVMCGFSGCGPTVQVAPITIEPITITVDINIKIDQALDGFFNYQKPTAPATAAATAPGAASGTAPATTN